jgi:hypothetical protein
MMQDAGCQHATGVGGGGGMKHAPLGGSAHFRSHLEMRWCITLPLQAELTPSRMDAHHTPAPTMLLILEGVMRSATAMCLYSKCIARCQPE